MFSVLPAVAFQLWAWQEKARGRRILFQRSKRWQEEGEKSQDMEEGTLWDSRMEGRQIWFDHEYQMVITILQPMDRQ